MTSAARPGDAGEAPGGSDPKSGMTQQRRLSWREVKGLTVRGWGGEGAALDREEGESRLEVEDDYQSSNLNRVVQKID